MANAKALEAAQAFISALSPEEQEQFKMMGENALEHIGNGVLMDKDYRQKTQEAAELMKKNQATEAELKAWRDTANETVNTTLKENEELKTRQAAYEARLETLSKQYGVPAEEIALEQQASGGTEAEAAGKVARQGGQAAESGNSGDYQQYVDGQVETSLTIQAQLADLVDEHREMFGSRVRAEDMLRGASAAGKPLREYWESEYNVADKRAELEKARQEEHDNKIREEAREEARREMVDEGYEPGASSVSFGSGLLDQAKTGKFNALDADGNPVSRTETSTSASAVDAAVKRFRTEGMANLAKHSEFTPAGE